MESTPRKRRPAPPVLELIEPPRGFGFDLVELEELLTAVEDRLEYAGSDSAATLRGLRARLLLELGRLVNSV